MKRLVLFAAILLAPAYSYAQSIPRTADGKPDFTGVWAGPGFTHRVGRGDTDSPRVTTYDTAKMSPFKPGGQAFMDRKSTGNPVVDDPTASCLPNGLNPADFVSIRATVDSDTGNAGDSLRVHALLSSDSTRWTPAFKGC
jgi:hypothetical protein